MFKKSIAATLTGAVMLVGGSLFSAANALPSGELVIIKLSGDRGWTVECTFEREDKSPITKRARGKGSVKTFAVRGVTGGECVYSGPRRGYMQVRFTDESDAENCPFTKIEDQCIGRIQADAEGSFKF